MMPRHNGYESKCPYPDPDCNYALPSLRSSGDTASKRRLGMAVGVLL